MRTQDCNYMLSINLLILFCHHLFPLEITHYGYDDVETIETGFERYAFVKIQCACHNVDYNPDEPLFQIFSCQCPYADKTQCRGETVGYWHARVCLGDKQPPETSPKHQSGDDPWEDETFLEMCDREVGLSLLLAFHKFPSDETINGHRYVIYFHAAICVEAVLVVEDDAESLHGETHKPKPYAGLVLQIDVEQPQQRGGDVKPMGLDECCYVVQNLRVMLPIAVKPAMGMKPI